ncbi:MAG: dehydrogenase [Gammaproteobacteria bacterium]|nr:dehydrogenase [Gammaproteobacteria bacterium]
MLRIVQDAITFDDVLLVPDFSTVLPKDVALNTHITKKIALNIPIVSAAMDTVTEARLAIALAQEGGIGIIHKNMSIAQQAAQVRQVKKFESGVVKDPITAAPTITIRQLLALTEMHQFSGVPVVEGNNLIGLVTSRDVRFATDLDQPIAQIMTPKHKLVTVKEGASREQIIKLLHEHRIEKVLVVNDDFELKGLITVKDIQKAKEKPLACKDEAGQLRVGAAVGTGGDTEQRVEGLVKAGVDLIVVDTAHGHSQGVIERVRWIKKHFPAVQIIGGNIATADAAKALLEAGADAVKVGIGPGSICTTRIIAGVGVPQLTAISDVAEALKGSGVAVIADGGIRYSGDIVKAIAAGATCVMVGGLFAGTEESPGEVELFEGRSYKSYRGMGSIAAMAKGSSDRYFQEGANQEKLVPEGIEGRVPYKGSLIAVVHQLLGGLRSGMGYTGCATINELREKAKFVRISSASIGESHVHDVTITKEPPNYQIRSR